LRSEGAEKQGKAEKQKSKKQRSRTVEKQRSK
jgi:hypothetical protein